jgi:hypothetical protein
VLPAGVVAAVAQVIPLHHKPVETGASVLRQLYQEHQLVMPEEVVVVVVA